MISWRRATSRFVSFPSWSGLGGVVAVLGEGIGEESVCLERSSTASFKDVKREPIMSPAKAKPGGANGKRVVCVNGVWRIVS